MLQINGEHVRNFVNGVKKMSERYILANWKMNTPKQDIFSYCDALELYLSNVGNTRVIVFPSALYLGMLQKKHYTHFAFGLQHFYPSDSGNFTGEISPSMLSLDRCPWLMVGHSERRSLFSSDDTMIDQQLTYAFDKGYNVVYCIGEDLPAYNHGSRADVLRTQLDALVRTRSKAQRENTILIAYEPVWAIGTGMIPSVEDMVSTYELIENYKRENALDSSFKKLYTLYGGSVNAQNASEIFSTPMQGVLIGGASLDVTSLVAVLAL